MLHGDISNQYGYCIAFRCEDFLIKFKDETLTDRFFNIIKGKYNRAEIDEKVYNVMERLYKYTNYNVALVVETKTYKDSKFKELIDNLPYNSIILIDKPSQLAQRVLLGEVTYYIDDDPERRSIISSKFSYPLSELSKIIKIGVR